MALIQRLLCFCLLRLRRLCVTPCPRPRSAGSPPSLLCQGGPNGLWWNAKRYGHVLQLTLLQSLHLAPLL